MVPKAGDIIDGRFRLIVKIGEGGCSLVWLADQIDGDQQVAVKILKDEVTSERVEDIIRFKKEASTVSKLHHKNIGSIKHIGRVGHIHYIAMELIPGSSLRDLLEQDVSFSIEQALEIAIGVGDALEYVHESGVIHRDIKPGNIMVSGYNSQNVEASCTAKLIDFGLSELKELPRMFDADEISGTFGYMSPEQSGILKRTVDERSDLYSLGVVLYQLLTGELPFSGSDVGSILHQHVAKPPVPPSRINSKIPEILENVTLKLLSKEQEDRYQSATGLKSDLLRVQAGDRGFALGRNDRARKLAYRTRMIGRETEIAELKNLYEDACNGSGTLCLIRGEAGRGKTRLVEELRGFVFDRGGMFLAGKCLSQKNKIPHQPFSEALDEYLANIEKMTPDNASKATDMLSEAAGQLGEILVKLNPRMKQLLGEVPELVPLEPDRENRRFLMVCARLISKLGSRDAPVVLFLDDLQWADEGSLALLAELLETVADSPLLVLGTYRDDEVDNDHAITGLIEKAEKRSLPMRLVNIDLFDISRMRDFVSSLLRSDGDGIESISRYIHKCSGGNPFFAVEMLRSLIDEHMLFSDNNRWVIDQQRLDDVEASSSIIEILLRRMELLGDDEVELLSYAAVIGRKFDTELLFRLTDLSGERVVGIIDHAIAIQLLEESANEKGRILFVHDRIRDAFYHKFDSSTSKKLHHEIAEVIESLHHDNIDSVVFDLAHHFSESGDDEKAMVYLIPAAAKAGNAHANSDSAKYYEKSRTLLERREQQGTPLWKSVCTALAGAYLIMGANNEAISLLTEVLGFAVSAEEKAGLHKQLTVAHFQQSDFESCEMHGRIGLDLLGEKLPISKAQIILSLLRELIVHFFHVSREKKTIHYANENENEIYRLIIWYYLPLGWMYIFTDTLKFIRTTLRMLNIAGRSIGRSKELAMCLGSYASLCMAIPLFNRAEKYHQKALELKRELEDEWGTAQSLQFLGICQNWQGKYGESLDNLNKSLELYKRIGDMREVQIVLAALGVRSLYISDYEEAQRRVSERLRMVESIGDTLAIGFCQGYASKILRETGSFQAAEEVGFKSLKTGESGGLMFGKCHADINLGRLYIERGDYSKALRHLQVAKKTNEENRLLKDYVVELYPSLVDANLMRYKAVEKDLAARERRQLRRTIGQLCKKAVAKTKSWPNHHGDSLRILAKYYAISGKRGKADETFLASIGHQEKLGRRYELAKCNLEYAEWLYEEHNQERGREYLREAYSIFGDIGSQLYTQRVAEQLGIQPDEETPRERVVDRSRLTSIIQMSQQISSILDLDVLLRDIIDRAAEVTGAQRGFLLIADKTSNTLLVKSARNIDRQEIDADRFEFSRSIIDEVYRTGERIITTDAQQESEYSSYHSVVSYGLKSILCIPIKYGTGVTGVCYLDNPLSRAVFSEDDAELLSVFVTQAAISIANANAYETISQKANELSTIHNIGEAITSILNMDQLVNSVLDIIVSNLGYDRAMILLVDEERGVLCNGKGKGGSREMEELVERLVLPLNRDGGVATRSVVTGEPILINDVRDSTQDMDKTIIQMLKTNSFLVVPLKTNERVLGVLAVDNYLSMVQLNDSDISLLSILAGQVAISIENARLVDEVAEKERIRHELRVAHDIQIGLLPQENAKIPGYEFVGCSFPAEEVGGDFYNYYWLTESLLWIAVGDVSGKGVSAAMLMAVISGMIDSGVMRSRSPAELLMHINGLVLPRSKPNKMSSALMFALFDVNRGDLRIANAGLIPPLVCRADGTANSYIDVKGFPLGVTEIGRYGEADVTLESDDVVVFSSDGIVEARDPQGEMFGFDRLLSYVSDNRELSAQALSDTILRRLREHMGEGAQQDDITLVVLKRT